MNCPKCGGECERDMVDVGVGEMPAGPWGCFDCGWVEIPLEPLLPDPEDEAEVPQ